MNNRIKPVDGLRAFAVLGVLWSHIWMFFGNIPLTIAGANVNTLFGSGYNGVDLFFVISGFCMYLMYAKKATRAFSAEEYGSFLAKRWKRIAPAFYFVVLFECVLHLYQSNSFPLRSMLFHFSFLNIFDSQNVLSPPFWSLATEWHFYLVLPLIFIKDKQSKWIVWRIVILMIICMIIRFWHFSQFDLSLGKTIPTDPVWFRFVEFGWGMLAAVFYTRNRSLWRVLRGNRGILISLGVAMIGRMCMVTGVYNYFGEQAYLIRGIGEPVMTFGFALLILNVISSESIAKVILQSKPVLFVGKVSYSMYLWHWILAVFLSSRVISMMGVSNISLQLAFLLAVLILIPVSYLSFRYFELPYFKKQERPVNVAVEKSI